MRVGIITDVYDKSYKTGIAYYIKGLVKALKKICPEKICLIHSRPSSDELYKGVEELIYPSFHIKISHDFPLLIRTARLLKRRKIDLLHIPALRHSHIPFFWLRDFKIVTTMHDTTRWHAQKSPLISKIKSGQLLRWIFYCKPLIWVFPATKRKVDRFIAVSKYVKQDMIKTLKVPQSKINVVYEAVDTIFKPIENKEKINLDVEEPYILTDGLSAEIVKIYSELKNRGIKHKLVVVNIVSNKKCLDTLIQRFGLEKEIIFLGYVSHQQLLLLYNKARLLLNFALCEGFGLTPLEAMACGCPVVSSNSTSLPEVIGKGGVLADSYHQKEWVERIYQILTNENFRQNLIKKGLEQAKKFSWDKIAKETIKVYQEVLNENSSG